MRPQRSSTSNPVAGLRVGLIAPPWVPVPPSTYGGTELVIDLLARGLTDAGCDVALFTTGDATCPVPRFWHHRRALGTTSTGTEVEHVRHAYRAFADVDLVHDHTDFGPISPDLHPLRTPVVTTMHGPLTDESRRRYATAIDAGVGVIAISHAQRRDALPLPIDAVIHHGIEIDTYPLGAGDGGYVVFLGRMSPTKGVHRAIEIARAAGRQLLIAAKMWEPAERAYFDSDVAPLLGPDVEYIGPVQGDMKRDLLGGAEALLNPIRWPEPFGLVIIEAMACGTPVLSFAEGAATELVDHGRTGFLCADEEDMAARLGGIGTLDRSAIRANAAEHFSVRRMIDRHLDLYAQLTSASAPDAQALA